jgi:hypothetical protein
MKKLCATLLMTVLPLAGAHAAGQLEWRFDHDEGAGFLGVVNSVEADNPKPHYPFLMTCSTEDEWSIYISDIDVKALGETIAKNEQPTFLIATTKDGKTTESQAYYPDISYNQEEAKWEYSSTWDTTTLDHLAEVEEIRVKGTGLDNALPKTGMAEAIKGFKDFCAALDTGGGGDAGGGAQGGGNGTPGSGASPAK